MNLESISMWMALAAAVIMYIQNGRLVRKLRGEREQYAGIRNKVEFLQHLTEQAKHTAMAHKALADNALDLMTEEQHEQLNTRIKNGEVPGFVSVPREQVEGLSEGQI